MLSTIKVRDIRPGHFIAIGASARWCVTRRESHGDGTTTLTISNINHVLDVRTIRVHDDLITQRVVTD